MDFFKIHLKEFIAIFIIIILFIIACIYIYQSTSYSSPQSVENIQLEESSESEKFYVDIKGEVLKPGVYEISSGTILSDLIKIAGGTTAEADLSNLNLASNLTPGLMIIIPNKKNISSAPTSNKISINRASLTELQTLPGIGQTKAQNIINYRQTNGYFQTIEDLQNVEGIGTATYEKLKPYITL